MIGLFDSGVGGLSIFKALLTELPGESFIYLADSAYAPYGEREAACVVARSRAVTAYLRSQGVRALVVACNTATAIAIDTLRAEFPDLPIIGVEPGLKPALALSRTRRVGVMATRGTLASARFKQLLASLNEEAHFVLQPCDGLAMAIERSLQLPANDVAAAEALRAECARHLKALGRFGTGDGDIDTLVLGCTHYPFATATLRSLVGPAVQFIDPGEPVARQTRLRWQARPGPLTLAGPSSGSPPMQSLRFISTGEPDDLQRAAQRWLGLEAERCLATRVDLPDAASSA